MNKCNKMLLALIYMLIQLRTVLDWVTAFFYTNVSSIVWIELIYSCDIPECTVACMAIVE